MSALKYALEQSAETHIEKNPNQEQHHSRSAALEKWFKDRQVLKTNGEYDEAKKFTNRIMRLLRKERLNKTINELKDNQWHDIKKHERHSFHPTQSCWTKNKNHTRRTNGPEILVDYFKDKQWAIDHTWDRETPQSRVPPHLDKPNIETGKSIIQELNASIKKPKSNKSPGPDGIPVEFSKMLGEEARFLVLDVLNDCWKNDVMPSELELAKLGNFENPANYRPIAL